MALAGDQTGAAKSILAQPSLTRTVLRNTVFATAGGWAVKILHFLFSIYVIRVLGEVGFGQYHSVVAFVGLFGVFLELGMSQYVGRAIAQDHSRAPALFWNLIVLRLLLVVPGSIAIVFLSVVYGFEPPMVTAVVVYTLTFILAAVLVPLTTVIAARERFDVIAASQVLNQVLTIAFGVPLLWFGVGFYALIYTSFLAMPVQVGICLWAIRRYKLGPLPFRLQPGTWPAILRAGLPFGLISLALTFNYNVDTVILRFYHGDGMVGWYHAAYRMVFNIVGLVSGFLVAMTPSLTREHVGNPERVRAWVRTSVQWMALFALPVAMGVSVLSQPIADLLFGPAFGPSGLVLAIVIWDVPLLLFIAFCGNVTTAVGLEHPAARTYLLCAGLNVVLNLLLIPAFAIYAAAAVTVTTDALAAVLFYGLLSEHMRLQETASKLARTVLATLLMGAAVALSGSLALPLAVGLGVVVYALLLVALRLVDLSAIRLFVWGRLKRGQEVAP
ncbi:MAG: flippase [Chloroflexota bacterium]